MTRPRKEWLTPPEIWAREEAMKAGWIEGKAEGKDAGRREGTAIGERTILRKQLTLRFGTLPDDVLARLDAADTVQFERGAERVLDAQSLADFSEFESEALPRLPASLFDMPGTPSRVIRFCMSARCSPP